MIPEPTLEFEQRVMARLDRVDAAIEELRSDWRFDLDNIIGALRLIGQALDVREGIGKIADNIAVKTAARRRK